MPTLNARQINGVVRTTEPVWANIERLSEAASVWFTYDTHAGVYAWVINEAGNSVATITEADIIGPIQVSGSGLTNLYNSVEIQYPRNDMNDLPHYVTLNLPSDMRNAYEPDNCLQISSEFINNQPQAEYVAMVTLKQSRLDTTVTIVMDYTKINLQAGDIIGITSATYGWTAKEFRIMRVREIEGDDGSLRLEFSCTEYDDTIYDGTWDNFTVAGATGIRSIGSIATPVTPVAALVSTNAIPGIQVTTTVPTGVVDRMQVWSGNVSATGNVANTTFVLAGTIASNNGNSFTSGANVTFNINTVTDGTYAFKTRGVNDQGTSAFSSNSANLVYASGNLLASSTSNAAATSAVVLSATSNAAATSSVVLLATSAAAATSAVVINAMANSATSGTIWQAQLSNGYLYSATAGTVTSTITQSSSNVDYKALGSTTFTAPVTTTYKVDLIFDQNSSGAIGGRGSAWGEDEDTIRVSGNLYPTSGGAALFLEGSGGEGAQYWTDFALTGIVNLTANVSYTLLFDAVNFTESFPSNSANFTVGWNVYTIG